MTDGGRLWPRNPSFQGGHDRSGKNIVAVEPRPTRRKETLRQTQDEWWDGVASWGLVSVVLAVAVDYGEAAVLAEGPRGDLHPRGRLAALVLVPVDG